MKLTILSIYGLLLAFVLGCQPEESQTIHPANSGLRVCVCSNGLTPPEVDRNPITRGGSNENTIVETQVLVFDENDQYCGLYPVENSKVEIPHAEAKRTVYVVANASAFLVPKRSNWETTKPTLDEVISSLYQERAKNEMPQMPFVMYAKLEFPKGINNNSAITSNGTHTGAPLLLKRNVAKITVTTDASLKDRFVIKRYMLCKAPKSGYLIHSAVRASDEFDHYTLQDINAPLYGFVATSETTIILEAEVTSEVSNGGGDALAKQFVTETRYFKIAIRESDAQGANGLKQNNWYKINIVSQSGSGFADLDAAISGHVFDHVDYTLEVKDITMHDFLFGEGYFIATSNSIYKQYGKKADEDYYTICLVRFVHTDEEESEASTTRFETSVEVEGGAASGIELDPATEASISSANNHETYPVRVKFTGDATEGIVRLNFNSIHKDISVKKHPELPTDSDQFVPVPTAVIGAIENQKLIWCGINDERAFTQNKLLDTNSSLGKELYLTIRGESELRESREVTAFFSRVKTGLTKVSVYQNSKPDKL